MLSKPFVMVLLGSVLFSVPAFAQTPPSGSMTPAAGPMGTSNWMTQEMPGQWRASKLEGLDVYNSNDEKIGDISELLVDGSGGIRAIVIGVGGFLGMGEHQVAVPFDQVTFVMEPGVVATTSTAPPAATAPSTMSPNVPATTGTVTTDRPAAGISRAAPDHAMLKGSMTKDQLKAAPEFKFAR